MDIFEKTCLAIIHVGYILIFYNDSGLKILCTCLTAKEVNTNKLVYSYLLKKGHLESSYQTVHVTMLIVEATNKHKLKVRMLHLRSKTESSTLFQEVQKLVK